MRYEITFGVIIVVEDDNEVDAVLERLEQRLKADDAVQSAEVDDYDVVR